MCPLVLQAFDEGVGKKIVFCKSDPGNMSKIFTLLALALQLLIIVVFYRLFFEETTFVVRRATNNKLPILRDAQNPEDFKAWRTVYKNKNFSTEIVWNEIPQKPTPPDEEMNERWIVVTTINSPTEDVKKLSAIEGWKVVVVGDTKTPADWSHPNCVFLSVERQKTLGYRIHDLLKYRSYPRKNIGYLYAIQHGAKIIYETDDDNSPTSGKITFYQEETGDFFVYKTDSAMVNPYDHFGQSTIWPRGYPLDHIGDPPSHRFFKCKDVDTSVQQGVVNGDPDVDAIFRLTRKDKGVDLKVEFDAEAPPVVLPPNTLAPFNSQNTLFLHKAFWALLLPTTVTFRVCDIWRGYWAQRLMWDVGTHLSFFPPNAVQFRNAHNYLSDFKEEKMVYYESGRLIEFLNNWKSDKPDFFSRVLDLSLALAENGFWGMNDALLTKAWLTDLVSIGYEIPSIKTAPRPCVKVIGDEIELHSKEKPSSYLRAGTELKNIP